jgi:hypothetical protein
MTCHVMTYIILYDIKPHDELIDLPSESLKSTQRFFTCASSTEESETLESSELDPLSDEDACPAQKRDIVFLFYKFKKLKKGSVVGNKLFAFY